MVKPVKIAFGCLCVLLAGCKEFPNPFAGDKVLARVGERTLLMGEVTSIFTPGLTPSDSVKLLESYVDMWVKKQLKVQEAERMLGGAQRDIDRMVEDYRNSLLSFKIDQYYVDRELDTLFTDGDIRQYYDLHRSDFVLDRPIVRGVIVRIPATYRQQAKLKELMRSAKETDRQDFLDICQKNDFELKEFPAWTEWAEFVSPLPVRRSGGAEEPKRGEIAEYAEGGSRYLVLVTDYLGVGQANPVERVREVIRRVLFNQRKSEIIRRYEDSIYRAAVEDDRKKTITNS